MLLNEVMKKEGYATYLAANGIEALSFAEEHEMDCVLLDMKIPGMNGIEILKRLKEKWPGLPVFMMTAYGELNIVQEALSLGAIRYFTKPFDIFEVRDEVNKILKV
ncbi:chemotaxis protein CheY [Lysinibacillus contaminans]|uniref:Chemotaxis protein CheY n=1 Tax=Lysinibacillus contaminans TaxID=1293441 RepID=A0ABR5JXT1_9BACI|nr:chemotaxis protein CheY [Lysinibacillus contaminans]